MNNPNIFFSYARADPHFAKQLANKLSEAGENVWLDQFNIGIGEKWDNEIQKALESSKVILVLLSKSSVKSENVMDEVSYALEEGKKVIPVLLENCEVPFRLRRLQYVNFSLNYFDGMRTLCDSLQMDEEKKNKLLDPSEEIKLGNKVEQPSDQNIKFTSTPSRRNFKKYLVWGSIPLILLIIVIFIRLISNQQSEANATEHQKGTDAILQGEIDADNQSIQRDNIEPQAEHVLTNKNTPQTNKREENLKAVPPTENQIKPISFNVEGKPLTLRYNILKLSRTDTFKISESFAIQDLITALENYYNLSPPRDLLDQYANGNSFKLNKVLWSEHKPLYNSGTLASAGLKNNDLIEFHYELTYSNQMACPPQNVQVKINEQISAGATLYLNGHYNSTEMQPGDSSTIFLFQMIGDCNPRDWFCELITKEKTLYFVTPEYTEDRENRTLIVSFGESDKISE